MEREPFQYEKLLLAASRAKRIRTGEAEAGRRGVRKQRDGSGVSGSDLLAAILAEAGHVFTPARDLMQRWKSCGGRPEALRGTLLAFRRMGHVDETGIASHGGVMDGSYRLSDRYLAKRKARAAAGAKRAFESLFAVDQLSAAPTSEPARKRMQATA